MLPVVRGETTTRHQIVAYALLLVAVTIGPVITGLFGTAYLIAALGARRRLRRPRPPLLAHPSRPRGAPPLSELARLPGPAVRRHGPRPGALGTAGYRVSAVDRDRARATISAGMIAGSLALLVFALAFYVSILYLR